MPSPLKSEYCQGKKGKGCYFLVAGSLFHLGFSLKERGPMQNTNLSENPKFYKDGGIKPFTTHLIRDCLKL